MAFFNFRERATNLTTAIAAMPQAPVWEAQLRNIITSENPSYSALQKILLFNEVKKVANAKTFLRRRYHAELPSGNGNVTVERRRGIVTITAKEAGREYLHITYGSGFSLGDKREVFRISSKDNQRTDAIYSKNGFIGTTEDEVDHHFATRQDTEFYWRRSRNTAMVERIYRHSL